MRALVYDEYTSNDDFSKILKIKNLPEPEPRSNEVVFKVMSAALNYDDIWGMRGKPLAIPLMTEIWLEQQQWGKKMWIKKQE